MLYPLSYRRGCNEERIAHATASDSRGTAVHLRNEAHVRRFSAVSCRDTADILRATGRRFTVHRLRVASALRHSAGHRTAEEIHRALAGEAPEAPVPLSTVYRTLADLKAMRLVAEVAAPGKTTYEWVSSEPHHHLRCERCGAEIDLDPRMLRQLGGRIERETGFQLYLDHVVLAGLCPGCAAEADDRGAPER